MKRLAKKIAVLGLTGIVMSTTLMVEAKPLPNPVTVKLDEQVIGSGYISSNGSTMIPLRVLSESLNYQVAWNSKEQEAVISDASSIITLSVGYHNAKVNDRWVQLQSVPEMVGNTVYVPLRVIADTMGLGVGYVNRTAYISSTGEGVVLPTATKQIPMSEVPSLLLSNGYRRFGNGDMNYIRYLTDGEGQGMPRQISFVQVVPELGLMTLSLHENNRENIDFARLFLKSVAPTKADTIYQMITTQDIIPLQVFEADGYKVAIEAEDEGSSLTITCDATKDGEHIENIKKYH
ncbi:MAG: copper amine oxidase N-terminal domain-containing protein [Cellulosilyticaceae bacterium]